MAVYWDIWELYMVMHNHLMSIGLEYKYNNLSAEIGYLEHTMKYDAKSFTGGLKYNF